MSECEQTKIEALDANKSIMIKLQDTQNECVALTKTVYRLSQLLSNQGSNEGEGEKADNNHNNDNDNNQTTCSSSDHIGDSSIGILKEWKIKAQVRRRRSRRFKGLFSYLAI